MQVDDQVAGIATAVEHLVHHRQRLDGSLERSDGERRTSEVDERPERPRRLPVRAHERGEQEPEGGEHEHAAPDDQRGVQPRHLLGPLRRQAAADDEPSLVEAEVEAGAVEGE